MGMVRVMGGLAFLGLLGSVLPLLADAQSLDRPYLQYPAVAVTLLLALALAWVVLRAPSTPPRAVALRLGLLLAVVAAIPLLRYLPAVYHFTYERDIEGLFPPLWPYSVALPPLVVALAEAGLPLLGPPRPSGWALALTTLSAVLVLFFGGVFVVAISQQANFLGLPFRTFRALVACLAISALLALGGLLPRKGATGPAAALLLASGLLLEGASIAFYDGPPAFLDPDPYSLPWPPTVALLGGTLPGAITAVAGLLLWRDLLRRGE